MRGEGNSVILIKRESLPGPEDAHKFNNFVTTRNFNEIERSVLLIMIICEILLAGYFDVF